MRRFTEHNLEFKLILEVSITSEDLTVRMMKGSWIWNVVEKYHREVVNNWHKVSLRWYLQGVFINNCEEKCTLININIHYFMINEKEDILLKCFLTIHGTLKFKNKMFTIYIIYWLLPADFIRYHLSLLQFTYTRNCKNKLSVYVTSRII